MSARRIESLEVEALLTGYQRRWFTPIDVINEVYDRIEAYHDRDDAVWISLVPREEAAAYAADLTEQFLTGRPSQKHVDDDDDDKDEDELPALLGVPFSVKDNIDVAGLPTTAGCPSYAYTPARTAFAVQRLLDTGAVLVGKTNMDQLATGLTGCRSPYGTPRCVYDPAYVPGGSSSGAAVSVAARLVSFAVGSDTAGSIRVPAALNGLVGWKPTLGTVSAAGVVPAVQTADCVCVVAKTVDDVHAAWSVMRAFDEEDPYARREVPEWPWLFPGVYGGDAEGEERVKIRFGIPPAELLAGALSPDYAQLFAAAVDALSSVLGWTRRAFDYAPFAAANEMLYGSSIVTQRLVAFESYLREHGLGELHPVVRQVFAAAEFTSAGAGAGSGAAVDPAKPVRWSAVDAYRELLALQRHRRAAELLFRNDIHVLVVPTTPGHPTLASVETDPLGTNRALGTFTQFVNMLDLCAIAVPAGTWRSGDEGGILPFGLTLVAQAGRDYELLELARTVMAVL